MCSVPACTQFNSVSRTDKKCLSSAASAAKVICRSCSPRVHKVLNRLLRTPTSFNKAFALETGVRNQEVIMPSCRGVVSSSCATRCAASHTPEAARRVVAARQFGRRMSVSAHAALPTHSEKAFQAQHILFYDPHASTPRPLDQQPHSNQTAPAQPAAGQLQPEGPVKGLGVPANAEAEMRRQRRRARVFIVARALSSTLYKLLRGLPKRLSAVQWDCEVAPEEAAEALFRVLFTTSKNFSTTRLEAALRLGILPELATLPARAGTPSSPVVTVTANSVTVTSDPALQPELQPQQLLPPDRAGDEVVVPQQHAVDLLALLSKGPVGCEEVDEQDVEAALGPLPHEWYAVVDTVRELLAHPEPHRADAALDALLAALDSGVGPLSSEIRRVWRH